MTRSPHCGHRETKQNARERERERSREREKRRDARVPVVAAIDVIAHEQEVGVRRFAADAEQLHQVVELAVHVAAHGDRALDGLHIGLLDEGLACLPERRGNVSEATKYVAGNAMRATDGDGATYAVHSAQYDTAQWQRERKRDVAP